MTDDIIATGADWQVRAIPGVDGPGVRRLMRCVACEQRSPTAEDDLRPVTVWAMVHTRLHPTHTRMVMVTSQRMVTEPRTQPPAVPTPPTPAPAPAPPPPVRVRQSRLPAALFLATMGCAVGLLMGGGALVLQGGM